MIVKYIAYTIISSQQIIYIPETHNVSFDAYLDVCDLVDSKWTDYRDGYKSWDNLILIFAWKNVRVLTDSHNINNECNYEANEQK